MRLYRCPICDVGRKAPDKLATDDARRFCLKCTEKTGKLVEMIVPAHESAKAERAAARAARREQQRQREAARERIRLATWPGLREARHARWADIAKPLDPAIKRRLSAAQTIPYAYAELVNLTAPHARTPCEGTDRFLKRVGVPKVIRGDIKNRACPGGEVADIWRRVFAFVQEKSLDWVVEDIGIDHDREAVIAIRGTVLRTDLYKPDDVLILNNIITNALDLHDARAQETP
ncbi:MAG TPA: hypothetical protein VF183_07260 [Acidimicrobiales bacterium]